jgi:hypothetical protein
MTHWKDSLSAEDRAKVDAYEAKQAQVAAAQDALDAAAADFSE